MKLDKIKETFFQFKGLTTIGVADVAGNVISALFWLYMATILGAEHYGQVSYFLAIGGIASAVSLIGAQQTLTVYTAKNVKIESPVYFISIISGSVISIILFLIFNSWGLGVYTLGTIMLALASSEILGRKLYSAYSKYLFTQRILMVGLSIGLYYLIGTDGVLLGLGLAFFPYIIRIYKGFKGEKLDFSLIRPRFGFMMNSYALNLMGAASGSIDKLIIAPLVGFTLLGNYQLGLQFFSVLLIVPSIVYKYTLPKDASGDPSKKLKQVTIIVSAILTIAAILLSPIFIPILFPKYTKVIEVIQITSLSLLPSAINLMYHSKFTGLEKIRIVLISQGINLGIWIITIILLGKIYGINGIASALVISATIETFFLFSMNQLMKKTN